MCHLFVDLRESTPATCVPLEEVEKKVEEWKMAAYFEVSSLFNVGLAPAVKQCVSFSRHVNRSHWTSGRIVCNFTSNIVRHWVQVFAWSSIAQSVCEWAFSMLAIWCPRLPRFESCILQRKTTYLLSIRKLLVCARASKLITTKLYVMIIDRIVNFMISFIIKYLVLLKFPSPISMIF